MRLALALAALALAPLLAGCAAEEPRPPLRAAPVTLQAAGSEGYPGLVVQGTLGGGEDGLLVRATARNEGNRTYQVESGCGSPWAEQLFRGNDSVELRAPTARCQGFSLSEFAPDGTLGYDASWDGRVWDPGLGRMVPATPGQYTWSVRFVAYPPDAFAAKRFDLDFNVTVLD